jgi:hypothetical protein
VTSEVIEPEAAALHLARAYELSALSWAACVQTGKMDLIEQAQAALDAVKQAQRHLPEPSAEGRKTHESARVEDFSLSDLSALESVKPDLESLRTLLGQALTVAERIDQARGRSYPEPVGGSRGWDFAEEVNQLLARVELDSGGARGKGLE